MTGWNGCAKSAAKWPRNLTTTRTRPPPTIKKCSSATPTASAQDDILAAIQRALPEEQPRSTSTCVAKILLTDKLQAGDWASLGHPDSESGFGSGRVCPRNSFEQVYPHGGQVYIQFFGLDHVPLPSMVLTVCSSSYPLNRPRSENCGRWLPLSDRQWFARSKPAGRLAPQCARIIPFGGDLATNGARIFNAKAQGRSAASRNQNAESELRIGH